MIIKPKLSDFKSITIVQTAFIGDIALALPLASTIKHYAPNSIVNFVSTPISAEMVALNKDIDNIISYDKRNSHKGLRGISHLASELKALSADCIITAHRSARSSVLTYLAKPKFSVGFDRNALSFLYSKIVKYNSDKHEVERNISLLSAFEDKIEEVKPNLQFSNKEIDFFNTLKIDKTKPIICVAPGSVWYTKRWLPERFAELSKKLLELTPNLFIIGAKADIEYTKEMSGINLCGITSIPQTIYLLSNSDLLISNDSSPIHFAGLVDCPTIAIFGATSPKFGFAPRGKNDIVVEDNSLKCKPCRIHGSNKCPIGTFDCMRNISASNIYNKALEVLFKE